MLIKGDTKDVFINPDTVAFMAVIDSGGTIKLCHASGTEHEYSASIDPSLNQDFQNVFRQYGQEDKERKSFLSLRTGTEFLNLRNVVSVVLYKDEAGNVAQAKVKLPNETEREYFGPDAAAINGQVFGEFC
jgi:hypothetical protein